MAILRRRHILHLAAALLLLAAVAGTQTRRRPNPGPRALAVVEWTGKGGPRLVPITIMVDGQFFDATVYKARPVPMAIEPETVYEVVKTGESQGLFIVRNAQPLNGAWVGVGEFRVNQPLSAAPANKNEKRSLDRTDEPPVLRRPGSQAAPAETAPPEKKPDAAEGPPVLKKPAEDAAPKSAQASSPPASEAPKEEEDPNRPVLRRGKPAVSQAEQAPESVQPPSTASAIAAATARQVAAGPGSATPPGQAVVRVLPAFSDAKQNDARSYAFDWRPDEQQRMTRQMETLALEELRKWASTRPGHSVATRLEDAQVRAFDLDLSNEATLVLTARAPDAPPAVSPVEANRRRANGGRGQAPAGATPVRPVDYYITAVARVDINGDLRRTFALATDSQHLDAYPRLELIDAVDADGDGRAELLFRATNDIGRNFVVYRVTPDQLTALYNGAAPLEQ